MALGLAALIALRRQWRRRRRRHAKGADRGPTREHGNWHQSDHSFISIRVFFADNFVQYGTSLPLALFTQLFRHYCSLLTSRPPSRVIKLRAAIGYLLWQTLSSRVHLQLKFLNPRTLATNVWPIQFSNRSDVCWVGLDNKRQQFTFT